MSLTGRTFTFNDEITIPENVEFYREDKKNLFISKNERYYKFAAMIDSASYDPNYIEYVSADSSDETTWETEVTIYNNGWEDPLYQTITFIDEPTYYKIDDSEASEAELLTWLGENATEDLGIQEYSITTNSGTGGTLAADVESAAAGDTVTLTIIVDNDYQFVEYQTSPTVTIVNNTFTMPEADVTITAVFEKKPIYGLVTDKQITSIADAIRAKTGSNQQLEFPDEFIEAIEEIQTGSSSDDRVIFIDYDGTVVQKYTVEEAQALTSLPANPSHPRLIAQGWNWTLEQIKAQLSETGGDVVVGQLYTTVSGAIEIDITLDDPDLLSPYLIYAANGEFEIDWGDNSTNDNISGTSWNTIKNIQHIYSAIGNYTIKLIPSTQESLINFYNSGNSYSGVLSNNASRGYGSYYSNTIINIHLTNNYYIRGYDFNKLNNLKTITHSNNMILSSSYGNFYLNECCNLTCITFPQQFQKFSGTCKSCYTLKYCSLPYTITQLSSSAFYYCQLLQTITISKNLTTFSEGSIFSCCYALEKIILPETILSIPSSIFSSCYNLKKIKFSQNLTSINSDAFYDCYNLENITIPNSVTSIGSGAFRTCHNLIITKIPSTMTALGNYFFSGQYFLETILIPPHITTLGAYLFQHCYNLKQMVIPSTVTTFTSDGTQMFYNCKSLKSLEINNNITTLGVSFCSACQNLYKIKLPNTLTTIKGSAFYNCQNLTNIIIPENVTSIESNVFYGCYSMQEYHFKPITPPTLANTTAFSGIPYNCIIYVPYSSDHSILAAYQSASNWSTYADKMQEEPAPISE